MAANNSYWKLALNQHAVTIATVTPYDTMRLHALPVNVGGDSLTGIGMAHYSTTDTAITVTANGLVTARYETISRGKPAFVVASLSDTAHNITHADTAFIQVTPTVPASLPATLSVQFPPYDSAKRAVDYTGGVGSEPASLSPTLLDANGSSLSSSILVAFWSSDPYVDAISTRTVSDITSRGGDISPLLAGQITLYASAWAYGIALRDSVVFTSTTQNNVVVTIQTKTLYNDTTPTAYFFPQSITIGVGGIVTWDDADAQVRIDVVFDNPANIDSAAAFNHPDWGFPYTGTGSFSDLYYDQEASDNGDFDTFLAHLRKARRFPVAGVYHYHSTIYGSTGTIVVQ